MLADLFNNPIVLVAWLIALIVAITVHEFAHAFAAEHLGDPTPRLMGRLTLNPLAHLDPIGTLMILIARFGWGKPVQFDPYNLKNIPRDSAIISLAGPVSNLITATLGSLLLRILLATSAPAFTGVQIMYPVAANPVTIITVIAEVLLVAVIQMNVGLAIFNLIPIYPLDGFAVVGGLLPKSMAREWETLKGLGIILLIVLVFPLFGSSPVLAAVNQIVNTILSILLPRGLLI